VGKIDKIVTLAERPRTQSERTQLAENRMIEAAVHLLNNAGMSGTTLKAIGEESGYSRGLATHHFGSKSGLFRKLLNRVTAIWTAELLDRIGDRKGLDAIVTAVDAQRVHITSHPKYIRAMNILWYGALDPASSFKPNLIEFMKIQRDAVAEMVVQGQASGEIRKEVDPALFAEQFYGTVLGINHQWLVSPDMDIDAGYMQLKQNTISLLAVTNDLPLS
jgi:AcrR family transcriptional regulator